MPMLTREAAAAIFATVEDPWRALDGCIAVGGREFDSGAAGLLAATFLDMAAGEPAKADRFAKATTAPLARYLAARHHQENGRTGDALIAVSAAIAELPAAAPALPMLRARLSLDQGDAATATADLRAALRVRPEPGFFVRHQRLIRRIVDSAAWTPKRRIRAAMIGSSTLAPFADALRAACFRDGIAVEIELGKFDGWQREIIDPGSFLYASAIDFVVIVVNHRDVDLPAEGGRATATAFAEKLRGYWLTIGESTPAHIVQLGIDLPPLAPWGGLESTAPEGRRRLVTEINLELAASAPATVTVIDPQSAINVGATPFDLGQWHTAKIYPSPGAAPAFADAASARIRAALGVSAKVLVVDLDNTLWGGIVGEDGLDGIVVGPPDPSGEAYRRLQLYMRELAGRGVLLAVCSKNNDADARLPFQKHDSMVLRLDDFAAFVANWNDKATSLETIAGTLNLGLDSFVFLDDNPAERDWVRRCLPDVAVVDHDGTPEGMLAALDRGRYFETLGVTEEDRARPRGYAANARIAALANHADSLDVFLGDLQMICAHGPVDALRLARVTQLINKTNQFNLTGRRYTESQIRAMADDPALWLRWFHLRDRYGDHGLIGVMAAGVDGARWEIDLWLMSCRVLGRQVEDLMAAVLLRAARAAGAAEIVGAYVPSAKNGQVAGLLPRFGFEPSGEPNRFVCRLRDVAEPESRFIREQAA